MGTKNKKNGNIPNLRFKGFEGEWGKYKISDFLDFFSTNSLSWEQLDYESKNIYNLHYGLIHKGLPTQIDLNISTLPSIISEFEPKNYSLCKDGDVSFADASEDTNDVAKVVEFYNCGNKKIVCGLHTIHGRDKLKLTVIGFKGYAFSSDVFRNQIRKLAQGTKVFSISQKNFNECHIGIPSKEEQIKVSSLLLLIDERIATQMKTIEEISLLKDEIRKILFKRIEKSLMDVKQAKDLIKYEQPTKYIVSDTDYSTNTSLTPVLTANKAFILGYTDEKSGIYDKGECIIFDDFTMDLKYVNFPFKVKSSAIKILTPKSNINLKFVFEYFSFLNLQSREHKRHYISEIETMEVPFIDTNTQKNIANLLSVIDNKINLEKILLKAYQQQKKYLLQNLFI